MSVKLRPTFSMTLDMDADEAMRRIRSSLEHAEHDGGASHAGRTAELFVPVQTRRFWSPHLSIQVHDEAEGSVLHGRFAPRPEVWTFFMFIYFLMAFVAIFGATFGYVQWASGESPWGFYLVPLGVVVVAGLHGASMFGQHLSRDQMSELRGRVDRLLQQAFEKKVQQ